MAIFKQSTAKNLVVLMIDATDPVTGLAGLTLTITASKDGAAFASISPTVTDLSSGYYKIDLTSSHTDTLGDLALYITATGAYPLAEINMVNALLPWESSGSSVSGTQIAAVGLGNVKILGG